MVLPEEAFALKACFLQGALRSEIRNERRGVETMQPELPKNMRRKNPDRSRHQSAPAVRLGQPVAELGTVPVFRQCTHKPDHADQFSTRLTNGETLLRNARLLLTTLQPRVRIGFGIWKRHRQGVARNLRIAQV